MLFGFLSLGRAGAQVSKEVPAAEGAETAAGSSTNSAAEGGSQGAADTVSSPLPSAPGLPVATVMEEPATGMRVTTEADTESRTGPLIVLDGNVVLGYGDRRVEADHVEYNSDTGELTARGHLHASGGKNHEEIRASHGEVNLRSQVGTFYDVSGSVGLKRTAGRMVYLSGNPFLFTGREVRKTGPESYAIVGGTVTTCRLPRPDWLLSAGLFKVDGEQARAKNGVFRLLGVPLLWLPYVTHPTDTEGRQSGLLIPVIGQSSTKGTVLGEQAYIVLGRSSDLTVGAEYFSMRGWLDQVTFRHVGRGDDFAQAHYSQLFDRGFTPANGVYTNQGGEDLVFSGRHDFSPGTRIASDLEYLSSYVYREAFTENFNQAVSTDIVSTAFGQTTWDGYTASLEADRYQGLKRVEVPATDTAVAIPGQEIRLFHVPALELGATEHRLGGTPLEWAANVQAAGLKRVQPNFATGGVVERVDLHPTLAMPFGAGGWRFRPSLGGRETVYSRSGEPVPDVDESSLRPVEVQHALGRADVEAGVEVRAPVVERVFHTPFWDRVARGPVKHTVEPFLDYRYVAGVDNFQRVLRFDDRDVVSDTNELEYGLTQRLFARSGGRSRRCGTAGEELGGDGQQDGEARSAENAMPAAIPTALGSGHALPGVAVASTAGQCTTRQLVSWTLAQKTFFNPGFGGAVVSGRRNILASTLDLSGVAFLTEPRNISPLVSRLQIRSTEFLDLEWDFDLDTGAKKFTSNNVLLDVHRGVTFAGLSYARLNAPGRSYVEGVNRLTSDFDQMRVLAGYGSPMKRGLSVAANAGLDLDRTQIQYAALQTSYNWNCCGFAVEYRKYELGSVRNENAYRFNFTLANIGTAGNLRRAERLF